MGLVSAEDIHDTTIRGDDYVDEPPETNNDDDTFDQLVTSARTPTPPPLQVHFIVNTRCWVQFLNINFRTSLTSRGREC